MMTKMKYRIVRMLLCEYEIKDKEIKELIELLSLRTDRILYTEQGVITSTIARQEAPEVQHP
jgi:hypothetical protein